MQVSIIAQNQEIHADIAQVCSDNGLILTKVADGPECLLCNSAADLQDIALDMLPHRPYLFVVLFGGESDDEIEWHLDNGADDILSPSDLTEANLKRRISAARFHRFDLSRGQQAFERLSLFESVVLNAKDAVLITNPAQKGSERKILYANAGFTRISGYTMDEVMGRSPSLLQGPLTNPQELKRIRKAVAAHEPVQAELVNYHKNGTPYWIEISIVPIFHNQNCTHFVAIQRDVTARKQTERDLRAAQRKAEQASLSKSRFLASASHDLRQPIQALTFLTSVLSQKTKGSDVEKIAGKIDASLQDLSNLFNAILDISKLETGITNPDCHTFNLSKMLERIARDASIEANKKDISFKTLGPPVSIHTDPVLLERMIRNIASNAIRYTDTGGVLLAVRRRPPYVWIDIFDTGIGIPQSKYEDIFEEFQQLHNPERQRNQGLGLGLSIVRRIASLLDLQVTVRSTLGRGSRFRLILPEAEIGHVESATTEGPALHTPDLNGIHILLVENDTTVREATAEALKHQGAHVQTCVSANAALTAVTQHMPDVLITDYRLGGDKDGIDLIGILRTEHQFQGSAILITGDTAPDRIQKAQNASVELLFKPIGVDQLSHAIYASHSRFS